MSLYLNINTNDDTIIDDKVIDKIIKTIKLYDVVRLDHTVNLSNIDTNKYPELINIFFPKTSLILLRNMINKVLDDNHIHKKLIKEIKFNIKQHFKNYQESTINDIVYAENPMEPYYDKMKKYVYPYSNTLMINNYISRISFLLNIDKNNITTRLSNNCEYLNNIITSVNDKKKIVKFRWYHKFNPIGQIFEYEIRPGDSLIISTKNIDISDMNIPILLQCK